MDKTPEMVTFTIGDDDDKLVLDIPLESMQGLSPDKKQETVNALSRFIVGLTGNAELKTDDIATVLAIDGMLLTLPGAEGPVQVREMFGDAIITGSPADIATIQQGQNPQAE